MSRTNPHSAIYSTTALADCIEACLECAQTCTACADACMGEAHPEMLARCMRLNLDCADLCGTTARMLSRQLQPDIDLVIAQVVLCARACGVCADECDRHGSTHDHCRICAAACRRCETACNALGSPTRIASTLPPH